MAPALSVPFDDRRSRAMTDVMSKWPGYRALSLRSTQRHSDVLHGPSLKPRIRGGGRSIVFEFVPEFRRYRV